MMNEKTNWINWKRIVIFIIATLCILFILYVISFFKYIDKSKLVDFSTTENIVYEYTDLTSIEKAYQFQDEVGYHIVFGKDNSNEDWIVFIPLAESIKKDELIIVSGDSVKTKEQIENSWKKECNSCVLTGSTPAMIKNKPLWELTYTDQSNRYVIEYVSLESGSTYEKMRLFRNYIKKG